jgi:broad specificity phosphatase PhoE
MVRSVTRWWWIRHAPIKEAGGRVTGQLDLDADCRDERRFKVLAERLPEPATWMISQLRRTRQTADALLALSEAAPPGLTIERDFAEQDFGDWQGKTYAELERDQAEDYARFWVAPGTIRPPGGESFADVMMRVSRAVERRSGEIVNGDIVAIGHGGSIRAAVAQALGLGPARSLALQVDPLSLTRLDRIADRSGVAWSVGCVNA